MYTDYSAASGNEFQRFVTRASPHNAIVKMFADLTSVLGFFFSVVWYSQIAKHMWFRLEASLAEFDDSSRDGVLALVWLWWQEGKLSRLWFVPVVLQAIDMWRVLVKEFLG